MTMRELAKYEVQAVNGGLGDFPPDDPDFPQDLIGDGVHEIFSPFMRQRPELPVVTPTIPLIWHGGPNNEPTPPVLCQP
jgi:hypothetical protein